jgi:hypothetical protein
MPCTNVPTTIAIIVIATMSIAVTAPTTTTAPPLQTSNRVLAAATIRLKWVIITMRRIPVQLLGRIQLPVIPRELARVRMSLCHCILDRGKWYYLQ